MKIALISDLHTDINAAHPVLETVAAEAESRGAEMLLVAGDICEDPSEAIRQMHLLDDMYAGAVRYVPGNHDLWNKHCPERDIVSIFDGYMKDPLCLCCTGPEQPLADGPWLVGDPGWYDYSFAAPGYTKTQLDTMSIGGRTWQDKLFNAWTEDNAAAMSAGLERLREQLEAVKGTEVPVIAVTHMLPVRDFLVPADQGNWGFFNAFLGSSTIEELYMQYPVKYAVCGHVHYRLMAERDGITHICPCLGYESEWPLYKLKDNDVKTHVADAMQVVEI